MASKFYIELLIIILFSFFLISCSNSQTIENNNSPNSINVQGNNNTINFNVNKTNELLLKYFIEGKTNDETYNLIINKIIAENIDTIPKSLLKAYANGILNIYETLYESSELYLNDTVKTLFNEKVHVFDIGVHTTSLGHDIFLAFKLLPIERKAKVTDVIDFLLALRDLKVAKGIIMCNGGFSDELIEYAEKKSIDLCVFKDASSINWSTNIEIPVVWIKSTPLMHFTFGITLDSGDKIPKDFTQATLSYNEGIDNFTVSDIINYNWVNNKIPHITDSTHLITMKTSSLKLKSYNHGWKEIDKLNIYYTSREEYFIRYFKPEVFKAIENYITKDVQFTNLKIEIEIFDENDKWVKIGEDLKEDYSEGKKVNLPKGLSIIATQTIEDLSTIKMDSFSIKEQ